VTAGLDPHSIGRPTAPTIMAPAFLIVFAEPGEQVTIEEFQDWYDNEHVPLRMDLPSFLTAARFSASDSVKPSWVAMYDVDDTATFGHESYTRLRATRSHREADLVERLEVLDRRLCEVVWDSGVSKDTSSMGSTNPICFVVTHGVGLQDDAEIDGWARGVWDDSKSASGWLRMRVLKCFENGKTGTGVGSDPEEQVAPKYLAVHELGTDSPTAVGDVVYRSGVEVVEWRRWELYKAYPGIAQGNLK